MNTRDVKAQRVLGTIGALLILVAVGAAQDFSTGRQPTVSYSPPEVTAIDRGHLGGVTLQFRIPAGFHVNSHQPNQEYLKKTELRLSPPTDIAIASVTYPPGEDRTFPFSPDEKLSVYTGDLAIKVLVRPLKSVLPTKYAVHGVLKYQACDNAACYPPRQLAVSFEVKVLKGTDGHKKGNPPQSPHAHK